MVQGSSLKSSLSLTLLLAVLLITVSFMAACANAKQSVCEITNPALKAMPPVQVTLTRGDGTTYSLQAKLADNNATRAAGFQRVCESTIKKTPILFVFQREVVPSFHMNNVVAPIDIAFIKKDSKIDVIHGMQPYSVVSLKKPLYSSNQPIIAALETYRGFYSDHNIDLDSKVSWVVLDQQSGERLNPSEHPNPGEHSNQNNDD